MHFREIFSSPLGMRNPREDSQDEDQIEPERSFNQIIESRSMARPDTVLSSSVLEPAAEQPQ